MRWVGISLRVGSKNFPFSDSKIDTTTSSEIRNDGRKSHRCPHGCWILSIDRRGTQHKTTNWTKQVTCPVTWGSNSNLCRNSGLAWTDDAIESLPINGYYYPNKNGRDLKTFGQSYTRHQPGWLVESKPFNIASVLLNLISNVERMKTIFNESTSLVFLILK